MTSTTGYGAWWRRYADAGWVPLPVPWRRKAPPPEGFTGSGAPMPSQEQYMEWALRRPDANVAVRLPAGVLGVDVDDYAGKQGGQTIAALEERLGPLPPTFSSTSRDDGVSGIRFYAVPQGVSWRGGVSTEHGDGSRTADVDLIHSGYRYAVVAPSIHPSGRPYRWLGLDGTSIDQLPRVQGLAELPPAWIRELTVQDRSILTRPPRGMDRPSFGWVESLPDEPPCAVVWEAVREAADTLEMGSRHDAVLRSTLKLVRLASLGHRGVGSALTQLHERFLDAAVDRSPDEADAEWLRALAGAARLVPRPGQDLMCECRRDLFERALRDSVGFTKGIAGTSERELLRQLVTWSRGTWTVRCSQRQLGEAIGKKQPHVNRVLTRLRDLGWVTAQGDREFGEGAAHRLALPTVVALSAEEPAAGSSADNSVTASTGHRLFRSTGLGPGPAETLSALPVLGLRLARGLIGVPTGRRIKDPTRPPSGDNPPTPSADLRPSTGAAIRDVVSVTGKSESTVRRHLELLERERLVWRSRTGRWWRLTFDAESVADEIGVLDTTPALKAGNRRDRLKYYGQRAKPEADPRPARLRMVVTSDEDLIVDTSTGVVLERATSSEDRWLLSAVLDDE